MQTLEGRYAEALRKAETWVDGIAHNQVLALIHHGLDRAAVSSERMDMLIAAVGRSEPIVVAEVYTFRGETDIAFLADDQEPQQT